MIRIGLLYLVVVVLMIVATRRWYVSLCGLLFLTVLTQHPDMPTRVFGVPGLNPWNALLIVIIGCWLFSRRYQPPAVPAPMGLKCLLVAYVGLVVVCGGVGMLDANALRMTAAGKPGVQWVLVDGIINPLKYLAVGVLFFDGARTRKRVLAAALSAVGSSMCYALLMFKSMKLRIFNIDYEDARRLTDKLVGLFANDLGKLFAITIWAAILLTVLWKKKWQRAAWLLLIVSVVPPFVALKSRAGYVAFCAIGVMLGVLRWRRILIIMPVALVVVLYAVPSVGQRISRGFLADGDYDWNEVSAGRLTNIWPPVIQQIEQSPVFGHGRYAILREDCYEEILYHEKTVPSHPHNSYLEMLLDAGAMGLLIVMFWMVSILVVGVVLMRNRGDPLISAIGAMAVITVVGEMSVGIAGSSFFPTQSMVPCLCVWGAAIRVYVEMRAAARQPRRAAHAIGVMTQPQPTRGLQSA